MSDLLIRGMEMPTRCWDCPCSDKSNGVCEAVAGGAAIWDDRPHWCPLFPVPPHGRLIDDAELWVEINKICDRRDAGIISDLTCLQQLLSAIRHAPTIIPAEEEKS